MLSSSLRLALYCTVQNLQNPSLYLKQKKVSCIMGETVLKRFNYDLSLMMMMMMMRMCGSIKYPHPTRKSLEFPSPGVVLKVKYEAKLAFPEWWGEGRGQTKTSFSLLPLIPVFATDGLLM